jgi:hypothetical protein
MEENEIQAEEEVVQQEETTQEEESQDTSVTVTKEEFDDFTKWKTTKEKRQSFVKKAESQPKKTYDVTAETLERIELRQDGYSKEEVESILDLGGKRALENPLVKGAIEQMRAKQKSDDVNVANDSKSPVYKKFTQADLTKMSSEELAKILPQD